jgi:hypothetical protein
MLFRLCYESKYIANWLDLGTPLAFNLDGEPSIHIEIRKPITDNSDRVFVAETEQVVSNSPIIEAIANFSLTDEQEAYLVSLGKSIVYPDSNNGILGCRNESGNIDNFPKFSDLSSDLQERLGTEIHRQLADKTKTFIKTLHWRFDIPREHHSLESDCMEFSIDGSQWHPVPADGISINLVELSVSKPLDEEGRNQLVRLWQSGGEPAILNSERICVVSAEEVPSIELDLNDKLRVSGSENLGFGIARGEPLYHELFREAWEQRRTNPRSAIVIGIAAAESGIKQCTANLVPSAAWFVQQKESPPIIKIMKNYFPTLSTKAKLNGKVFIPKSIYDEIDIGVQVRNKLAHAGVIPEYKKESRYKPYHDNLSQKTEDLLLNILDLLWLLDYYSGHEWALDHVREEILIAQGIKGKGKKKSPTITTEGWHNVTFAFHIEDNNDISRPNI